MKINTSTKNHGFMKILEADYEIFLIDANILIPPNRSKINKNVKVVSFNYYKKKWIEPFIETFKPIGIHEAVYKEFNTNNIKDLIDERKSDNPPSICIFYDSDLKEDEEIMRATIEYLIAKNTNYEPALDNKDDRGEVKSLAYIATKKLLYFCSHDANAIRLIEYAEKLETNLDEVFAIQPYEIMYYFKKYNIGDLDSLKALYKYMYRLTTKEKYVNPQWNEFIERMDVLYT